MKPLHLVAMVLGAGLGLWPALSAARSAGIVVEGCDNCHVPVVVAQATITASPATLSPGDTVDLTITVRGNSGVAGFYLTAGGLEGMFLAVAGEGTRLVGTGVVHATGKTMSGGQATFRVQWRAPSTPGGTDLKVWAVAANRNGASTGDGAADAQVSVVYGCSGTTYYRDFDGDGVGAGLTTRDCAPPPGYAAQSGDCDDGNAQVKPGAAEACNLKDDDCDGEVDEGLSTATTWPDVDGDGSGAANGAPMTGCSASRRVTNNGDCNDGDATAFPGAPEVCNGRDDNCDGRLDDGVQAKCGLGWCRRLSPTCDVALCDPGQPIAERCNAFDDDCDGVVDNGDVCPTGQACHLGRCLDASDLPPVGAPDAGAVTPTTDAGVSQPPPVKPSGCAAAPGVGLWAAAAVVSLLRRRRR